MSIERAKKLLKQNEGISLEFKESKSALPSSLFETICAMLNRNGGDIFLGVKNNGEIIGVLEDIVQVMLTNITNLSNNTQKLDPPFILFPQLYVINKQTVVHIQVPSSSQIHKSAGNIFDRSNDGDFKVIAKNANNPHGDGPIDANNFAPFPKNPTLAKFFIQIGRVDELGSGLLNVTRYIKHYAGKEKPLFIEGSSFSTEIPIPSNENGGLSGGSNGGLSGGLNGGLKTLLNLIEKNPGLQQKDLSQKLNNRPLRTLEKQINFLVQNGNIIRKGSPKSGGYFKVEN